MTPVTQRRLAAFHEAGHTVARIVHGVGFDRAVISADGTGSTRFIPRPGADHFRAAVRSLSGPTSEWILGAYERPIWQILGGSEAETDLRYARAALRAIGAEHRLDEAIDEARRLVMRALPAITLIAMTLEAEGEIGPDAARAIVAASGDQFARPAPRRASRQP